MTTTTDELTNECQCGCGTLVKGKYAKGHWAKAQAAKRGLRPLPGPDDPPEPDEELPPELVAELDELDWLPEPGPGGGDMPRGEGSAAADDPPPARIPPSRTTTGAGSKRRTRVTATIQRDVQAKIRMVLVPAGQMWAIRDQMCGPVFVQQEPAISEALAEIVCDSPDLLNWFTGPAGGYMKYFKLIMAVQPVALVVWMHHVAHADRGQGPVDGQAPQYEAYAA